MSYVCVLIAEFHLFFSLRLQVVRTLVKQQNIFSGDSHKQTEHVSTYTLSKYSYIHFISTQAPCTFLSWLKDKKVDENQTCFRHTLLAFSMTQATDTLNVRNYFMWTAVILKRRGKG